LIQQDSKRSKTIASLHDALEALFDIWYTVEEEKEKAEQILSYVNKVLDQNDIPASDKAVAYYIRGAIYFKQNRFSEAEQNLKKAITLDEKLVGPKSCANAYDWLGYIYKQKGKLENAIKTYQEGIRRLQKFYNSNCVSDLFYSLAETYIDIGIKIQHKNATPAHAAINDAISCLYQGFKMDRSFESYKFGDALYLLGYIHESNQILYDRQKAIEWYERFLQLTTDDSYYKERRRDAKEAIERLKERMS
jgi:tetratricopeptide (TPR) repeat protein